MFKSWTDWQRRKLLSNKRQEILEMNQYVSQRLIASFGRYVVARIEPYVYVFRVNSRSTRRHIAMHRFVLSRLAIDQARKLAEVEIANRLSLVDAADCPGSEA